MTRFEELVAARTAAEEALEQAGQELLDELVAAKDAYRADPTEANRERKAAAVAAVQEYRAVTREGRDRHGVGGDAFVMPEQRDGGE